MKTRTAIPHVSPISSTKSRASRAAMGAGAVAAGLVGAFGLSVAGLKHQATSASSVIIDSARAAAAEAGGITDGDDFHWQTLIPSGDGVYLPNGAGPSLAASDHVAAAVHSRIGGITMVMLGDSTAVGYGAGVVDEKPGVVIARGTARSTHHPVLLSTHGKIGSGASDLARQVAEILPARPDIAVIMVGANDVRDRIRPKVSARHLGDAVATLRSHGILVVVGTCPDLGVIVPIAQPLRRIAGVWSRVLAAKQEHAVNRAGGVPIPLGRLVSPGFYGRPDLFYVDGFHPNGLGYAKACEALLPDVISVLRTALPNLGYPGAKQRAYSSDAAIAHIVETQRALGQRRLLRAQGKIG